MTAAPDDLGALWLHTLQRAVGRASHDVKDALNGISVNLEVIRLRAARADTPASSVARFGDAATQQYERLTPLIDALLALGRAEREPADIVATLHRVATLCSASASSGDATVRVIADGALQSTLTRVHVDALRLALAAPLLDLVAGTDRSRQASEVQCSVRSGDDAVEVVMSAEGRPARMPDAVGSVTRAAGVHWTQGEQMLTLAFPRA